MRKWRQWLETVLPRVLLYGEAAKGSDSRKERGDLEPSFGCKDEK